jgi:hypothetical protein
MLHIGKPVQEGAVRVGDTAKGPAKTPELRPGPAVPDLRAGAPPPERAAAETPAPRGAAQAFTLLALDLGLPGDALSAALLSFVRHFSLPSEPALLSKLRREALSAKTPRESAALGAAAAAAKGLELNTAALERYAAAIDPTLDPGIPGKAPGEGGSGGRREKHREEEPKGEDLQKKAAAREAEDPLLGALNRVPDRDGRRWMVFPFSYSAGDREFRVSLRILLAAERTPGKPDKPLVNPVDCLAVDVAGGERRWLFMLNKPGRAGAETRLRTDPPLPEPLFRRFSGEIRSILGGWGGACLPAEEGPFFIDAQGALSSVNEEV